MLYACIIGGWEETIGFGKTEETAIRTAMRRWKYKCAKDVQNWTRTQIKDYFGLRVEIVESGDFLDLD